MGRRRLSVRARVLLAVAFAALVGVVSWVGFARSTPTLTSSVLGYQVAKPPTSITVEIEVDRASNLGASCTVEAQDQSGDDLGEKNVDLAPGQVTASVTVPVSGPPNTGEITDCHAVSGKT